MGYVDTVGVGLTRLGGPFVAYATTAPHIGLMHRRMVEVLPYEEDVDGAEPYKAIRVSHRHGFAVTGNFGRTGTIFKQIKHRTRSPLGVLRTVMESYDANGAHPLLGGSVHVSPSTLILGANKSEWESPKIIIRGRNIPVGYALTLSTNAEFNGRLVNSIERIDVDGNTATDVIDTLAEYYSPLVVACALWYPERREWELEIRNLALSR